MGWKFSLPQTYLFWVQPSLHKATCCCLQNKSPGSGRFYFCCWFWLKITQVLDEILFITTLAGPAHLLQFVISPAGEHRGTAHPTPAWRCSASGQEAAGCPLAVAGTTLDGTRSNGPVLHVSLVRMPVNTAEGGWSQCWAGDKEQWAALSVLGGCLAKA